MSLLFSGSTGSGLTVNWSGQPLLTEGSHVVTPGSVEDVRKILRGTDMQVRVVGSRFSWPSLIRAGKGVLLDTRRLTGLIEFDGNSATFGAGTLLKDISAELRKIGRRIACSPGVIAEQTVGGAIGTGLHGQGMRQSSMSDAVLGVRIMDAHGEIRKVYPENPDFGAVVLNLGLLGVIMDVSLRTEPDLAFSCEKKVITYGQFLRNFDLWNEEYQYTKYWWFPESDKVHAWLLHPGTKYEARLLEESGRESLPISPAHTALNVTIDSFVDHMRRATGSTGVREDRYRTLTRFSDYTNVVGTLDGILCKGVPAPQVNLEIGLPMDEFEQVQDALTNWYAHSSWEPHYPMIVRCTGASRAWLSPAYGRPTVYYGFVSYLTSEGQIPEGTQEEFEGVQKILAEYGGRPHWGKYFRRDLFEFGSIYPRWQDFCDVRTRCDPERRFVNEFLASVLGSET